MRRQRLREVSTRRCEGMISVIRKLRQRPIVPFMLLLVAAVVAAGCGAGATDDHQDPDDPGTLMENTIPPSDDLDLPPTANEPLSSDEADAESPTPEVAVEDINLP